MKKIPHTYIHNYILSTCTCTAVHYLNVPIITHLQYLIYIYIYTKYCTHTSLTVNPTSFFPSFSFLRFFFNSNSTKHPIHSSHLPSYTSPHPSSFNLHPLSIFLHIPYRILLQLTYIFISFLSFPLRVLRTPPYSTLRYATSWPMNK